MNLFIKVGSVTNAQRSRSLLKSHGFSCEIKRIENPSPSDGCGYAVEVYTDSTAPIDILKKNGINIRGADFI